MVEETGLLLTNRLVLEESCEPIFKLKEEQANSWNTRPWHELPIELLELVV